MTFPPGKLPLDVLDRLLNRYTDTDERIIVGARVGEDATVIDFGNTYLVAKTDPITFATNEIGRYAIHVNANDIATMGATPRWFLATVLLPENITDEPLVESIFDSITQAAKEIGVALCGGHTEVTVGLDRPIVVGQMLGEVSKDRLVQSINLVPGDRILLTKGLGIEATAILAHEKAEILKAQGISPDLLARAAQYLHNPGISVLNEARIACQTASVHAMHDPTEGGVATALSELAKAANVGLFIEADQLFASDETRTLCNVFHLDLLGVISSGALLIGLAESDADPVCNAIENAGIRCATIGRVEETSFGLKIRHNDKWTDLPTFDRDEIGKVFS